MKNKKLIQINDELLNEITPIVTKFNRNDFFIGEQKLSGCAIIKYPVNTDYGFLSKLVNISGTIASIYFEPIEPGFFIETLSKNISRLKGELLSQRDALTIQRLEQSINDAQKLMAQIDKDGENVGTMSVIIMPFSDDDEIYIQNKRKTRATILSCRCKFRQIAHLQKECYKHAYPFFTKDEDINEILGRVMPLSAFVGGFPFSSNNFNDKEGYYFAKDISGGLVIFNPWLRAESRTNTNFTIMGVAGVGKSTVVKHLILSEYMSGTKIIIIDPEREYKELCKNVGGDWINAGGGRKGKINPLEIKRTVPTEQDDDENDDEGLPNLALHINFLEVFFKLYLPSINTSQMAIIKRELRYLYKSFNIDYETDITNLKSEDYPTMTDLYDRLNSTKTEQYEKLALLFEDVALGSDQFLWNGHTSIKANSKCICFDTFDLQSASENIKKTQYFNLLSYAWDLMSEHKDEKVLLISDEAYLLIDPEVPQSLIFLRNAVKRARKYEAGIVVISHSVVDFLDPKVKMYGQALLDIPTFKILMGADGQNLIEQKELFKLTQKEEEILAQKKRGHALCVMGNKKIEVDFQIPQYKFNYMGSSGGR